MTTFNLAIPNPKLVTKTNGEVKRIIYEWTLAPLNAQIGDGIYVSFDVQQIYDGAGLRLEPPDFCFVSHKKPANAADVMSVYDKDGHSLFGFRQGTGAGSSANSTLWDTTSTAVASVYFPIIMPEFRIQIGLAVAPATASDRLQVAFNYAPGLY